ncbi:glycoside hydrolase family 127 protein [Haloarcula sp. S1AR25-5A]|uniref:Glycoside hydrolase family 127 protein n=1 Tax=Haloarcula terrestris TaxID=2950533 RepID=A0AAE4JKS4_9EURY|nr:beta-L-arabinofuranosidase domain-containing protein [Haloarcula terrestris]MDS0223609.1 glycoside hydrolase family 127 protein [Haloarcula terrestris]
MTRQYHSPPLGDVTVRDTFWLPRLKTNYLVSLDHQYEHLQANGSLDNFRRVVGEAGGDFEGPPFIDANVYKWVEAASYVLATDDMPTLREKANTVLSLIEQAQADDGYLFTYFMLGDNSGRWSNVTMMHELYCAGHLIEAAVAHYQALDDERLLRVARDLADHIDERFGPDKLDKIPGHEEIELALVRLYRVTDEERYLDLAGYFIDRRGRDPSPLAAELPELERLIERDSFSKEQKESGWSVVGYQDTLRDESGAYDGLWAQDHKPVRDQERVEGHAVRAGNLYAAVAAYLQEVDDDELFTAVERLWQNMVTRRMYVTGGIGSSPESESFTADYDLPNDTAFAETCASASAIFWSHNMFELTGNGEYVDVLERILYNALLSGVSLDGTRYCYSNPLQTDDEYHRNEWFYVACCPPNLSRVLASLGKYIYARSESELLLNLYVSSTVETTLSGTDITVEQTTGYPWDGDVVVELSLDDSTEFALGFRIPGWAERWDITVDSESVSAEPTDGYVTIEREWHDGDHIEVSLAMEPNAVVAHPEVESDRAQAALRRGPLVYCLEDIDNTEPVQHLILSHPDSLSARYTESILNGMTVLEGRASLQDLQEWQDMLYRSLESVTESATDFTAIPYYARNNRESTSMTVWMRLA